MKYYSDEAQMMKAENLEINDSFRVLHFKILQLFIFGCNEHIYTFFYKYNLQLFINILYIV